MRPLNGLIRPLKSPRPFKGLIMPFKGGPCLRRTSRRVNSLLYALVRLFKSLIRPLEDLTRPLRTLGPSMSSAPANRDAAGLQEGGRGLFKGFTRPVMGPLKSSQRLIMPLKGLPSKAYGPLRAL